MDKKTEQQANEFVKDHKIVDGGGDPHRRRILTLNSQLRTMRLPGGVRIDESEDLGYVALNIPIFDMKVLQIRYPDLASLDAEVQHKAWQKFIASPESEPYKLRRRDGKKGLANRHGVIVR